MHLDLLQAIVIMLGLAIAVAYFCHLLRIPNIVALFLTGILTGPHGLGLIKGAGEVEVLAEVGIVLLLFTIGLEFSLHNLIQIRRMALVGGSIQVLLSFGA